MPQKTTTSTLPALYKTRIGNCCVSITLDIRNENRSAGAPLPVCIRFNIHRERFYVRLPERFTRAQYIRIVESSGLGRKPTRYPSGESPFELKNKLLKEFQHYLHHLQALSEERRISIPLIKVMCTGIGGELSFLGVWETEARKRSAGTRINYLAARKSFIKYLGKIKGFDVGIEEIRAWDTAMRADGLSRTTIGIYERACRVIWNTCEHSGYLSHSNYPFGKDFSGMKVAIPKGAARKRSWLTVSQMRELYELFISGKMPAELGSSYAKRTRLSLGMFLIQYLCNGFNLADAAYLTYNKTYFRSNGKALQFIRKKTGDRNEVAAEVIIPIIPELQKILDEIASPPVLGSRLFPFILGGEKNEFRQHSLILQENQNIRKRMARLTEALGWNVSPSGTWARHSFATNLTHAGVPARYISQSMGHATGENVTARYIDDYPLEQQMSFNSRLLSPSPVDTEPTLIELLRHSTPEKLKKILEILE